METAYESVSKLHMTALVTGETTELPDAGVCRDVCLGTNHPGNFIREVYYTILAGRVVQCYKKEMEGKQCKQE